MHLPIKNILEKITLNFRGNKIYFCNRTHQRTLLEVCITGLIFWQTEFFPGKSAKFPIQSIQDQPLPVPSKYRPFRTGHFPSPLSATIIVRIEFSPLGLMNDNNGHYYTLETTDFQIFLCYSLFACFGTTAVLAKCFKPVSFSMKKL